MIKRMLLVLGLCSFAGATQCADFSSQSFSHGKFITGSLLATTVMTVSWAFKAHSSIDPMYRLGITTAVLASMLGNSAITRNESSNTRERHAFSFLGGCIFTPALLWFSRLASLV